MATVWQLDEPGQAAIEQAEHIDRALARLRDRFRVPGIMALDGCRIMTLCGSDIDDYGPARTANVADLREDLRKRGAGAVAGVWVPLWEASEDATVTIHEVGL